MIRRTVASLAFLVLALAMAGPGRMAVAAVVTQGTLTVEAPEAVTEGQPFLVKITLAGPAAKVSVRWMDHSVDVAMALSGQTSRGVLLLAAGLGTKPGNRILEVRAERAGASDVALWGIKVSAGSFPEQRLKLPPRMVTPSPEDQARIERERPLIRAALATATPARYWSLPFARPLPGEVTSAFGLRRILNGQPRDPHSGVDFDAFLGEEIRASGRGRVVLTGDFYYDGNAVFIDHGQGVISMYFHLSRVDVRPGQMVERGEIVGLAGATGRATGPHLHFGLKILGQSTDPMALFTPGRGFDGPSLEGQ